MLEGCQGPVAHKGDGDGSIPEGSQTKEGAPGISGKVSFKKIKLGGGGRGRATKDVGEGKFRMLAGMSDPFRNETCASAEAVSLQLSVHPTGLAQQ